MNDSPPCPGPLDRRTWLQLGGLSLGIFLLTIAAASADEGGKKKSGVSVDHSSPQKIAESFRTAAATKDWNALFACATKQSHRSLVAAFFLNELGMAQQDAILLILKKHGIDPRKEPKPGDNPLSSVKAKVALFGDLAAWAEKNLSRKSGDGPDTIAELFAKLAFKNFQINGNKATAEVVVEGNSGRLPRFEFRRIKKQWYVHFDFVTAAMIDRAALDVRSLEKALELYAVDHAAKYLKSPKPSQHALLALTKSEKLPSGVTLRPYLSNRIKDPWGNLYYYQYPHSKFPKGDRPGIWSAGPDGKSGTKDDITNWNLKRN